MIAATNYESESMTGWFKYFALNISPLWGGEDQNNKGRIGTIEFRHMEGTTNVERIITWINLIVSLKLAAKKLDLIELKENIRVMNTTSAYYWLAEQVFNRWGSVITTQKTFQSDVETCITRLKENLFYIAHIDRDVEEVPVLYREKIAYNFNNERRV